MNIATTEYKVARVRVAVKFVMTTTFILATLFKVTTGNLFEATISVVPETFCKAATSVDPVDPL